MWFEATGLVDGGALVVGEGGGRRRDRRWRGAAGHEGGGEVGEEAHKSVLR